MTQHVERLDYSKPPPDFDIAGLPKNLRMTVVTAGAWGPNALTAAWALHKARHNPPGMWSGFYGRLPDLKVYTPRMGLVHGMELTAPESEHATPEQAQAAGREAAWVRYDRWLADGKWFDMPEVGNV